MKLISMTDFVLKEHKKTNWNSYNLIVNYANFLKQSLELWMFVACYLRDGIWIPYTKETLLNTMELFNEWEQAKGRCLFDGFEYDNRMEYWHDSNISFDEEFCENKKIEDIVSYNLTLTPTAIKQIGL